MINVFLEMLDVQPAILNVCAIRWYNNMGNNEMNKQNENLKIKRQLSTEPISVFRGEANFAFWLCNKSSSVF